MKKATLSLLLHPLLLFLALSKAWGQSEQILPDSEDIPSSLMTFFATSEPIGDGGNLGGLAGADSRCQSLAAAAGAGSSRTWRAYLSTETPLVNARDRIGAGPWFNFNGLKRPVLGTTDS